MKILKGFRLLLCLCAMPAAAQLQVLPDVEPQRIFTGQTRSIKVLIRNTGEQPINAQLRTRLNQTSSATTIPLGDAPWKRLEIPAGQTVLDFATLHFPEVRAETRFVIQWLEYSNTIIGTTQVLAYPTNLLRDLTSLARDEDLGLFDPQDRLKPLLKTAGVAYTDFAESGFEGSHVRLAVIGPFQSNDQMPDGFARRVRNLARKGAAIVWLQPPPGPREPLKPSFYMVPVGSGVVLVTQAELVADLPSDPVAQLHLLELCRQALSPLPLSLPGLTEQHEPSTIYENQPYCQASRNDE